MEENTILENVHRQSPGKIATVIGICLVMMFTGIGKLAKLFKKRKEKA